MSVLSEAAAVPGFSTFDPVWRNMSLASGAPVTLVSPPTAQVHLTNFFGGAAVITLPSYSLDLNTAGVADLGFFLPSELFAYPVLLTNQNVFPVMLASTVISENTWEIARVSVGPVIAGALTGVGMVFNRTFPQTPFAPGSPLVPAGGSTFPPSLLTFYASIVVTLFA